MKRVLAILLSLAMTMALLTSCGGGGNTGSGTGGSSAGGSSAAQPFSTDLAKFYEDNTPDDFPMMMELDDEMLASLYPGLEAIDRAQTVAYAAAQSSVACEVTMVEVKNADDVKAVQDILQARIDAQVDGGAWYPETIEQWEKTATIVTRDNYVCLFVVPSDFGDFAGSFNAL